MPQKLSDFRPLIDDLVNSSPLVATGRAVAKVGEWAQQGADRVQRALTPTPKRGDIALPADRGKNLGPWLHKPRAKK